MKIFHHNDPDGRCGAAIILKAKADEKPELIECDYKMEVPVDSIEEGEAVIIVDFSFEPAVMKKVLAKTDSVTWLDHHATAKAYEKEYGRKLSGLRNFVEKSEAGCELAWRYYFPEEPMPKAVRFIGDYDKWAHKLKDTKSFFEGLKLQSGADDPRSALWALLFSYKDTASGLDKIVEEGKVATKYRDQYCKEMRESSGYETELGGLKCYALNVFAFGSQAFGDLMTKYEATIAYIFDGTVFTVSMYSDNEKIDVSKVCKDQGGGGHKNAAGFTCKTLPFKPIDTDDEKK